uniref:Uncharacterized protein n=1 Tax=Oryza brachyantha TaxID=4533 RepID=J3MDW7_ORYBR
MALMPGFANRLPHVIEKMSENAVDVGSPIFGCTPACAAVGAVQPEFVRQKLYQLSPEEDFTLSQSLLRLSSYYVADMHRRTPFSEA